MITGTGNYPVPVLSKHRRLMAGPEKSDLSHMTRQGRASGHMIAYIVGTNRLDWSRSYAATDLNSV